MRRARTIGVARLDCDQPERRCRELRSAIHIMAAYVIGDDAELSWSKAEDAMRQEQCRQKGRL